MKTAIALINVQRNLRILGVFARLAKQQKPHYLDWAPRTWAFIEQGLRDPCMAPIASEFRRIVTPPTPQHIQWLRSC
jgi:aminoglycoside/choline kinase family phosphotransferase